MFCDCLSARSPTSLARGAFSRKAGPAWGEVAVGRELESPVNSSLASDSVLRTEQVSRKRRPFHDSGKPERRYTAVGPGVRRPPTSLFSLLVQGPLGPQSPHLSFLPVLIFYGSGWSSRKPPGGSTSSDPLAVHPFPPETSRGWRAELLQIRGKTRDSGKGRG